METGKNIEIIATGTDLHEATMRVVHAKDLGQKIAAQTESEVPVVTVFHETAMRDLTAHLASSPSALDGFLIAHGQKPLTEQPTQ